MTTMSVFKRIVGPRAPTTANEKERATYRLPNILLGVAALLLAVSMFLPYWEMSLKAPQYPAGLSIQAHVNRLTGDVSEIDGLNHYIGMRPLSEAAQLERAVGIFAVAALALLVLGRRRSSSSPWALLLALPAVLWPFIFLGDMYYWMASVWHDPGPDRAAEQFDQAVRAAHPGVGHGRPVRDSGQLPDRPVAGLPGSYPHPGRAVLPAAGLPSAELSRRAAPRPTAWGDARKGK